MSSAARSPSRAPVVLTSGAVRGWHILLLYSLIFVSMYVASAKLSRSIDPDFRNAWRMVVMQGLTACLVALVSFALPELRRSLAELYVRPRATMKATDVLLFVALMVTWALGAHRLILLFPLLHWNPSLFSSLGFTEHASRPAGVSGLFILFSIAFVAPAAEELVFRGYLLNLWRERWGLWPGILMSSVLFGLGHGNAAVFAAVGGVFFCLAYLRFGSLIPGTLLHSLYNIVGGPFGLAPLFLQKSKADVLHVEAWIPELVLTIAFFPLIYIFWRRFRPGN